MVLLGDPVVTNIMIGLLTDLHTTHLLYIFTPKHDLASDEHFPILRSFLPDFLARNIIWEVEPQPLYYF